MNIRKATLNDLSAITRLFKETINSVNRQDYSQQEAEVWSQSAQNTERWAGKINNQYLLLAEQNEVVTGFASLTPEGYLDVMFVHKDFQRQGIAQTLFDALEAYAKENNIAEITSDVSITARPFFEKNGFNVLQRQENPREHVVLTNFKMQKVL